MNFKSFITLVVAITIFSSCQSYKRMGYLTNVESLTPEQLFVNAKNGINKIMPGDALTITVNSRMPYAAQPFNLPLMPAITDEKGIVPSTLGAQSYLVDLDGNIEFPILGKLHVGGYTRTEVEDLIKSKIYPQYITEEPIVILRFVDFKVSVLGEVNKPGTLNYGSDKVDILDVLSDAGDLTIYGKRNNVLLKREHADGTVEFVRLNLQDKNLVLSPYFYVQQNDVIYVEPNKAKGNSSSIGSSENLTITVVSVLISVATLLITVFNK